MYVVFDIIKKGEIVEPKWFMMKISFSFDDLTKTSEAVKVWK